MAARTEHDTLRFQQFLLNAGLVVSVTWLSLAGWNAGTLPAAAVATAIPFALPFLVIALVLRHLDTENISGLAGLSQRSPLLAATMTISMVSLAGIPPLAGFFGKFLLLKSAKIFLNLANLENRELDIPSPICSINCARS